MELSVTKFVIGGQTYAIPLATASQNGLLSSTDFSKIASLQGLAFKTEVTQSDLDGALAVLIASKASQNDLNAVTVQIATLNGTGEGSIQRAIDDALNQFGADVTNTEVVNAYKDLVDWAAANGGEITAIVRNVEDLSALLEGIGGTNEPATVMEAIQKLVVRPWSAGMVVDTNQLVSHNGTLWQSLSDGTTSEPSSDNAGYRPLSAPIVNAAGTSEVAVMSQKAVSNAMSVYNLDSAAPLASGFYTSATARAAVPTSVRKIGLIITYKTDATTSVTEQFIGSTISGWATEANWQHVGSEGGNKILVWDTDAATTRLQVPAKERKAGMIISYNNGTEWVNEQYIYDSFGDYYWQQNAYWQTITEVTQETGESKDKLMSQLAITSILGIGFVNAQCEINQGFALRAGTTGATTELVEDNSFSYSSPIHLNKGETIVYAYDGTTSALALTDAETSYYTALFVSGDYKNPLRVNSYIATEDCYVCVSAPTKRFNEWMPKIKSGSFVKVSDIAVASTNGVPKAGKLLDEVAIRTMSPVVKIWERITLNLVGEEDFIYGYYIDANGNLIANNSKKTSLWLEVGSMAEFYSDVFASGSIVCFGSDFSLLGTCPFNSSTYKYTLLEGTKYIRFTVATDKVPFISKEFYGTNANQLAGRTGLGEQLANEISDRQKDFSVLTGLINGYSPNTLNLLRHEDFEEGYTVRPGGAPYPNAAMCISPYIRIDKCAFFVTNCYMYGYVALYDSNFAYLGAATKEKTLPNQGNKYLRPQDAVYLRLCVSISAWAHASDRYRPYLYCDKLIDGEIPYGVERLDMPYLGMKLVTIGDSITYQSTWQRTLCDITGMWYEPQEVRGQTNSTSPEGYGYIKLDENDNDTDEYFENVDGIKLTTDTVTNSFGMTFRVFSDGTSRYRNPARTAEGGETVMPVAASSIYSRASDSKYYKGDVVIVFAGANDRGFCYTYPTQVTAISDITGVTNLKTNSEDNSPSAYEIYTQDARLTIDGDYASEGDIQNIKRYNQTFRACYRGMLKKVIDANPNALIITIAPFRTFIKSENYITRIDVLRTKMMNDIIKEASDDFGCQCVDLAPIFGKYTADKYFGGNDGTIYIHPNNAGGKKIAEYIAAQVFGL